jgi:hypothetical protein
MQTVTKTFGVPVDYYARVDFTGFERGIDALGGIVVDVQHPILDDEYPTPDYGVVRVFIAGGPQWLGGARALEFARSRHSDNDFGRQSRQRQVILAAEHQLFQPASLPKLPELFSVVQQSVATNIPPTRMPWLASLALSIPSDRVRSAGITYDMVVDVNKDGSELLPDHAKIQHLFDTALANQSDGGASASGATSPTDPVQVEVLNGTTRNGLAAATATTLKGKGYSIANVAQAPTSDHAHTSLVDRSGSRHAAPAVARVIGLPSAAIDVAQPAAGVADVTVVLGYDAPDPASH